MSAVNTHILWTTEGLLARIENHKLSKLKTPELPDTLPLSDGECQSGPSSQLQEPSSSQEFLNSPAQPPPSPLGEQPFIDSKLLLEDALRKTMEEKLSYNLAQAAKQQEQEQIATQKRPFVLSPLKIGADGKRIEGETVVAGMASHQSARRTMEDASLVQTMSFQIGEESLQADVLGVFDGHGSAKVAEFVRDNLPVFLLTTLKYYNPGQISDYGIWKALKGCFRWLDRLSPEQDKWHGTTALVAFVFGEYVWIANAGDCRAVFCSENEEEMCVTLTEDAKLTNPRFADMVRNLQGKIIEDERGVLRVSGEPEVVGGLALAQAIGDHLYKGATGLSCISAKPIITRHPLSKGKYFLASDGFWNKFSSVQLAQLLLELRKETDQIEEIAERLVLSALYNRSKDNVSMIVFQCLEEIRSCKRARLD